MTNITPAPVQRAQGSACIVGISSAGSRRGWCTGRHWLGHSRDTGTAQGAATCFEKGQV